MSKCDLKDIFNLSVEYNSHVNDTKYLYQFKIKPGFAHLKFTI